MPNSIRHPPQTDLSDASSRGRHEVLSRDQHGARALRRNLLGDGAKDSFDQSRPAMRADADQVSAETLGFLPDCFATSLSSMTAISV